MPPDGAAEAGKVVVEENTGGVHDCGATDAADGACCGGEDDAEVRTDGDDKPVGAAGLVPQPVSSTITKAAPRLVMSET